MGKRHTLVHQIADWASRRPDVGAIFGKGANAAWQPLTWAEYYRKVRAIAKGLIKLGHQYGECVAIVGDNRPEWVLCQFGIMAAGGVPAPIYVTNTPAQVGYIIDNSKSKIAICDGKDQLNKYLECKGEGLIDCVEKIVTIDAIADGHGDFVVSLQALQDLGRDVDDKELDARLDKQTGKETALLIYTSGTTGLPKGVMLTNEGIIMVAEALLKQFPDLTDTADAYRSLSYLPLCHVAEQVFTNFLHLSTGGQVYFCPDLKKIKDYLVEVKPTIFLGVPRVWEKFEAALRGKLSEATGVKAKLAAWAMRTELECFKKSVEQGSPYSSMSRWLANKLVIGGIKQKLGLDQLKVAATGAAPISVRTQEFFASLGICVYEGYGMSETTGVSTVSDRFRPVFGAVGRPIDGVSVKIAEDGEILLKGKNMTSGYLHMPEKTAELLTEDGWLHTGDLGSIGADGNLRITGRKKDLLITAGGKNVAPAELEGYIKTIKGVGQAVVVGDRQPYLCALLSLDGEGLEDFCGMVGVPHAPVAEVAKNEKVHAYFEKEIEAKCNQKVARYQTIKKFRVLPVEFSVETDELTPTMKIKRNVINEKFQATIDELYSGGKVEAKG